MGGRGSKSQMSGGVSVGAAGGGKATAKKAMAKPKK